jgi:hypothetical protein
MIPIRGPTDSSLVTDPDVRRLVQRRFDQICDGEVYDYDRHGELIVVEPGDSVAALEEASGCPILHNPYERTRFGQPDFSPVFEAIDEHVACFEIVAILNDDGFGVAMFVPKHPDIDPELLSMCAEFSVPAADTPPR